MPEEAETTWRRINGPEKIKLLLEGIPFKDGEPVHLCGKTATYLQPTRSSRRSGRYIIARRVRATARRGRRSSVWHSS
ncbi:hypothetical protein EVC45_40680 [Paraburkholderia sp. UYCP14C]|nr:hypothetical protein EVC45_40680 [Paraburkholderia sp. UYCP14C]